MGILNVTPDSFADASPLLDPAAAVDAALRDGGRRRRPHRHRRRVDAARAPSRCRADEELRARAAGRRRARAGAFACRSRSTPTRPTVARAALAAGASIVNDISGLRYDPALARVVAEARRRARPDAHARPLRRRCTPRRSTTTSSPRWSTSCARASRRAADAGVPMRAPDRRSRASGLPNGRRTAMVCWHDCRSSRRRSTGRCSSGRRASRSCATRSAAGRRSSATGARPRPSTAAVLAGAHIVRVHAVAEMVQVVRVAEEIRRARLDSLAESPSLALTMRLAHDVPAAPADRLVGPRSTSSWCRS